MKEVAKLQIKDRTELFQATAISMGMQPNVIEKDFWVWTGYEFDEIKDTELIKYCDVVVVGPFILEQRDISDANRWRGSRNQRVIKVQESLATGKPVMLENIPNNE